MKYISYFLVLIVILAMSWSTSSSINLIINKEIKLISYVPNPIIDSTKELGNNLAISIVEAVEKDLNN